MKFSPAIILILLPLALVGQSEQPNILFIVMDDMGARDPACYGSTFHETPNIDRLAEEGMLFTQAYAACGVCSPTRASLLTGKYPATVGVTDYITPPGSTHHPLAGKVIDAPYVKQLPLEEFTVAEALSGAGYRTWHIGKWHLGTQPFYPDRQGFELNLGGWFGGGPANGYFSPWNIPTLEDAEPGKHLDDHLTDEAIRLISEPSDRPFFLNLWYYSVHTPVQAKPELVEKYEEKLASLGLNSIDALTDEGIFPAIKIWPRHTIGRTAQTDPVYAAMMESADANVGRIMEALKESGKDRDTIVVLYSDNGGLSSTFAVNPPTCNEPLRKGKGWGYEGGIRVPMIVRWPGRVEAGSRCDTPVSSPDFYPTFLAAAGIKAPAQQAVEGVSLLPLLEGGTLPERSLFWHYPHYGNQGSTPYSAIRSGDWKLIEYFEDGRLELYNLRDDLSESTDQASGRPMLVMQLHTLLKNWRSQTGALIPQPNGEWPGYADGEVLTDNTLSQVGTNVNRTGQ